MHSSPIPASPSMGHIPPSAVKPGTGARRRVSPSYSLIPPDSPHHATRSPPASKQNSLRSKEVDEVQSQVHVELKKYHEDEEDWDVAFEKEGTLSELLSRML